MSGVRSGMSGIAPLTARLEGWQEDLLGDGQRLQTLLSEHGSPVNLLETAALERNAAELSAAAGERGVPLRVFFARKANKAIAFVERARELGLGVDVASRLELTQVLDAGVPPADVIVTAAVKPRALLEECVDSRATVAIDNADELALLRSVAGGEVPPVAVRIAPGGARSRFGLPVADILGLAHAGGFEGLELTGLHFHLDGYAAETRVAAMGEAIALADSLRELGHEIRFVDMGGGVPMSYLRDEGEWDGFWARHAAALGGEGEALTFAGESLGYDGTAGSRGSADVYPYFQRPVRGEWLGLVLDARLPGTRVTVAEALSARELALHCEPGRSLLDGCGMTAARVEFRKQREDGTWLVGVAMNRTQCRSTSRDFMVDPLLVSGDGNPTDPIEGYLVGAYCIERELLSWRRFRFPDGVAVGDIVVFPNTAGYLMHILESASHQIPLARNVVIDGAESHLDAIDAVSEMA